MNLTGLGLFGKVPAQGDFLRVNANTPLVAALDRWLQEGLDATRRAGAPPLAGPVHFIFRTAGVRQVLIGTLAPSRDSVGREFPLVVFASLEARDAARAFPLVPAACSAFFAASMDLLEDSGQLAVLELSRRLGELPLPGDAELSSADQVMRAALRGTTTGDLVARLFADEPQGRHYYGFSTFMSACSPLRGKDGEAPGVTLDCPVRSAMDRLVWLELARRLLSWGEAPPALVWSDAPTSHLLISLGPAPLMMLRYLHGSEPGSTKLWPVTTDRPEAIHQAYGALGAAHRGALARPDLSLDALLTALANP
jgi:type VI secretion system protein ImpM